MSGNRETIILSYSFLYKIINSKEVSNLNKGEMFFSEDTNLLHKLAQKHELTKSEEAFMSTFLQLNEEERAAMIKCMSLMTKEDEYTVQYTLSNPDNELTTPEKRQLANGEFDAEEKSSNDISSSASTGKNGLHIEIA